jgi:hypothetical protein
LAENSTAFLIEVKKNFFFWQKSQWLFLLQLRKLLFLAEISISFLIVFKKTANFGRNLNGFFYCN